MKLLFILLAINLMIKYSSSSKLFSCDQGCKDDTECPTNSYCVAVQQDSDCGLCLCKAGYKTEGSECVQNKKFGSQKSGAGGNSQGTTTTSSVAFSTTSTLANIVTSTVGQVSTVTSTNAGITTSTQAGPTSQGSPPTPGPINCADYNCSLPTGGNINDDPFVVRSRLFNETDPNCKNKLKVQGRPCNMQGGGTCYGVYCLTIESGKDYCICAYNHVDRQCTVDKPGKCTDTTGQLPPNAYQAQNKRYRNKNNPDNGSIYGRHFASSFEDCIKLCQWTAGSCRSINYGTLADQKVCELISVTVTKGSLLESWMVDAPGWQYAQVV